jgi:hypothetical protein
MRPRKAIGVKMRPTPNMHHNKHRLKRLAIVCQTKCALMDSDYWARFFTAFRKQPPTNNGVVSPAQERIAMARGAIERSMVQPKRAKRSFSAKVIVVLDGAFSQTQNAST